MSEPNPESAPFPVESKATVHKCRQCGNEFGDEFTCPFCGAFPSSTKPFAPQSGPRDAEVLTGVIYAYGALLGTSLFFAGVMRETFDDGDIDSRRLLFATLAFQLVDTVIVLIALSKYRVPPDATPPAAGTVVTSWVAAFPVLALLIGMNLGYHALMREVFRPIFELVEVPVSELLWVKILVVCVQPAIVEELFFRKLAVGAMRPVMGTFATIFISSLMFGLAHIYVPLSMPYLVVAGMVFGWARIASGGLALPILLHFLHNLAVVLLSDFAP